MIWSSKERVFGNKCLGYVVQPSGWVYVKSHAKAMNYELFKNPILSSSGQSLQSASTLYRQYTCKASPALHLSLWLCYLSSRPY